MSNSTFRSNTEQAEAEENKRQHSRLFKPYPLELKELDFGSGNAGRSAQCTDISKGGICVETSSALTVGAKMQVRIHIPLLNKFSSSFFKVYENDAEQYFTAIAEVLWAKLKSGKYLSGMRFINTDESQVNALAKLINKYLIQKQAAADKAS